MILIPENKRYYSEQVNDIIENKTFFFLFDGFFYICVKGDTVNLSLSQRTLFYLENKNLKTKNDKYLHYDIYEKIYYISSYKVGEDLVNVLLEPWDFLFISKGTYAIITENIDGEKNYISRIIKDKKDVFLIDNMEWVDKLSNYCLFPESNSEINGVIVEKIKKGTDMKSLISLKTSSEFILYAFENLFLGLVEFSKCNFVHGDISLDNIVCLDSKFMFIDFDLHLNSENPKNSLINQELIHTVPLFIGIFLIFKGQQVTFEDVKNLECCEVSMSNAYNYYKNIFTNKTLANFFLNDMDIKRLHKAFQKYEYIMYNNSLKDIYNYLSVYQLLRTFVFCCEKFNMMNSKVIKFIKYSIDISSKRVRTANEVYECYKSNFISSKKRKIVKQYT